MRMELIQPFINAADAVFAESLQAPTKIVDLEMDQEAYRRKGVAALIAIKGDIEGRVILDLSPEVALKVASQLAGTEVEASEQVVVDRDRDLPPQGREHLPHQDMHLPLVHPAVRDVEVHRLDVDPGDVDDARELAHAIEKEREIVIGPVELQGNRHDLFALTPEHVLEQRMPRFAKHQLAIGLRTEAGDDAVEVERERGLGEE